MAKDVADQISIFMISVVDGGGEWGEGRGRGGEGRLDTEGRRTHDIGILFCRSLSLG